MSDVKHNFSYLLINVCVSRALSSSLKKLKSHDAALLQQ